MSYMHAPHGVLSAFLHISKQSTLETKFGVSIIGGVFAQLRAICGEGRHAQRFNTCSIPF
jgi:hypothetical protein